MSLRFLAFEGPVLLGCPYHSQDSESYIDVLINNMLPTIFAEEVALRLSAFVSELEDRSLTCEHQLVMFRAYEQHQRSHAALRLRIGSVWQAVASCLR